MSKVNLVILVDDEHVDRIAEVVKNLQSAGLHVEQSMEQLGIITGSCDSSKVQALSQVDGVSNVETERQYQIAPPESEIQ
jgi:translation elongation factor EF-1beta